MTEKKLRQFGHNIRKVRLVNAITTSFNNITGKWENCLSEIKQEFATVFHGIITNNAMARRVRDSVAPLRRSSAGLMHARIESLSTGAGRRYPVIIRKASLMVGSMRRVWALRHQTGVQYSAVEWTRARVAIRNIIVPAPQQAASGVRRVMSASCEVTQGVGDTWATCPTLLQGIWARGRRAGFRCCIWLSVHVKLLRWKADDTVFVVLRFCFQVWRYSPTVVMSLLSAPSTACQSPPACMIARSSAYACILSGDGCWQVRDVDVEEKGR